MSLAAILALAGVAVVAAAGLAYKLGAGNTVGGAIQKLPPVDTHNAAVNFAGNFVETLLKNALTGAVLQSFLQFLSTGPSPAAVLVWLEQNVGASLLVQAEAGLPAIVKEGLTLLGGSLPSVLGALIAKAAPAVAHAQASSQLNSAQILAGLTAASSAPVAPKAA